MLLVLIPHLRWWYNGSKMTPDSELYAIEAWQIEVNDVAIIAINSHLLQEPEFSLSLPASPRCRELSNPRTKSIVD